MTTVTPSTQPIAHATDRPAAAAAPAGNHEADFIRRQRQFARQRLQVSLGGATMCAKTLANPVYWYKRHPVATIAVGAAAALVGGYALWRGQRRETRAVTDQGHRVRLVREPGWLSWALGALATSAAAGPRAILAAAMNDLLAPQPHPDAPQESAEQERQA
jgi:hypothetical protein